MSIENYEYSRYGLGTVVKNSGIGLHMMWAPLVRKAAAAEPDGFDGSFTAAPNGINEDDELAKTVMAFSTRANHPPAGGAWPQFAEFMSGDPHLLQAQDMLSAFHDGADEGIDADGTISPDLPDSPQFDPDNNVYFGGDSLDGFVGQLLTAEGINKVAFLTGALAYDGNALGAIDLATYDPANGIQYFPHAIAVTEGEIAPNLPPGATALTVDDANSDLFDQASMLWATVSFTDMMNPNDTSDAAHLAYRAAFDGSPFPASASASETGSPGPYDLMKGTSKALVLNLMAMHRDPETGAFVDEAHLEDGVVVRGSDVSAVGSAYLIVALEGVLEQFDGTPLAGPAFQAVTDQANFLIADLSDGNSRYVDASTTDGATTGDANLTAQAAAVRALYVAARVTGDQAIAEAAAAAYQALLHDYYVEAAKIFRTQPGESTATYTPRNFAILSGALREAALQGGHEEASWIYTDVFGTVANQMQLAEAETTGETGGDSDGDGIPFTPEQPDQLPEIFAGEATFTLSD